MTLQQSNQTTVKVLREEHTVTNERRIYLLEIRKLSWQMIRVLRNILLERGANSHCQDMSDYGGLYKTLTSLVRRGLLDHDLKLTLKGRSIAILLNDPQLR
jgi:hypothetical protein